MPTSAEPRLIPRDARHANVEDDSGANQPPARRVGLAATRLAAAFFATFADFLGA
jgi:hypothetical protein